MKFTAHGRGINTPGMRDPAPARPSDTNPPPMPIRSHDGATGQIEVITGGMFSGKSEELIRRLRRALIARQRVQVFKPKVDVRHAVDRVVTRDQRELAAQAVTSAA